MNEPMGAWCEHRPRVYSCEWMGRRRRVDKPSDVEVHRSDEETVLVSSPVRRSETYNFGTAELDLPNSRRIRNERM